MTGPSNNKPDLGLRESPRQTMIFSQQRNRHDKINLVADNNKDQNTVKLQNNGTQNLRQNSEN